jgi:heme A synthase
VAAQVALGASVIWLRRDPVITSLHVVNGAAVLTTALLLAMRATKLNGLLQPKGDANRAIGVPGRYQEAHA